MDEDREPTALPRMNDAMQGRCRAEGGACRRCCPACNAGTCEVHCSAVRKTGHLCRNAAGKGTTHYGIGACDSHLGDTPNHQRNAQRKLAARAAAKFGLPVAIAPDDALTDLVHRSYGAVLWYAAQIAALECEDEATGRFDLDLEGKASVVVELYGQERDRLTKVAKACLDAGIAERHVQLAEAQGRQLAEVVSGIIAGVFAELVAAGLEADLLARIRRDRIPAVIRTALAPLTGDVAPAAEEAS